ncbi:uncharacterized protein LOC132165694 isoform X1 [Corylus avellana]|uniref:uncharacterized protein LOC132165694 isoform X1 n=1 Tax=Corylus avellana TaxID=13451 RepID=UPI00286D395A|nr:uncharacterized protein LOC132165694 isoform X1 [Corylus avellana]XP_059432348.1 uncharacterized protein LOC132165694 isoform X1 [Corylus avellana]
MAFVSGLLANCSGLIHFHPKLPFKIERHNSTRYDDYKAFQPPARLQIHRARFQYSCPEHLGTRYVTFVGRNHHQLSFHDDLPEEPFWLSLIKEASWGLKSLFVFLVEQPSQLKYIEWPGFQSTLKTATLTLVIVAVLIVALTSVDSALCYMLALILRRTP